MPNNASPLNNVEVAIETAEYDETGKPVAVEIFYKDRDGKPTRSHKTAEPKYVNQVPPKAPGPPTAFTPAAEAPTPGMSFLNEHVAKPFGNFAQSLGQAAFNESAPPVQTAPVPVPAFTGAGDMGGAGVGPLAPTPAVDALTDPLAGMVGPPAQYVTSGEQGGVPVPGGVPPAPALLDPMTGQGGGVVTLNSEKVTSKEHSPDALKALADSVAAQKSAIDSSTAALQAESDAKKLKAEAEAIEYGKFIETERRQQAIEKDAIDLKNREYVAEVDKMANMKLTTPHMFYGQSTSNQILAAISVSLGALGVAYGQPGTENIGIKTIQATLDRDIAEQKYNMDNQKDIANAKRTVYQDLVKKFGDERQARSVYQEMVMKQVSKEYDARIAATNSPILKAQGQAQKAAVDTAAAQEAIKRSERTVERFKDEKQATGSGTGLPKNPVAALNDGPIEKLASQKGVVEAYQELKDLYADKKNAPYLGRLDANWEEVKGLFGGAQAKQFVDIKQRTVKAKQKLRHALSGAGFTIQESAEYVDQVGVPTDNPANVVGKLDVLLADATNTYQGSKTAYAAQYNNDPRTVQAIKDIDEGRRKGSVPDSAKRMTVNK